jgi:two-component system sensor histidine kinase PilS (NtrC family)
MFGRVLLYTLLLGGTVALHIAWGRPEALGGPYVMVLFVLITVVFLISILYATLLRSVERLDRMALAQIAIDLLLSAVLVHFTGSAESGFVLFFFLTPITAALTLGRRAAIMTATAGSAVLVTTVLLGFSGIVPVLPGQSLLPSQIPPTIVGRNLLVNCGAMFALAALADFLADQLRSAATHVEAQKLQIDNLAALHADVVRCLTSGLITVDAQGRLLTLNDAAAEMLNLDETKVQWQPIGQLIPELAEAAFSSLPVRRGEIALVKDGRERILGISVSQLTNREDEPIGRILNFQDLTKLREMERAVKRSEHLAALGRVAAGVAHEIRNPMASISGSLELLRHGAKLEGDDQRLMDIALREIERLEQLIADLLTYARPTTMVELVPLDLGARMREIVSNISTLMTGNDAPEVKVYEAQPNLWIEGDGQQLRGVVWNLVRNAWQAGGGQCIDVRVEAENHQTVLLSVTDHGKGIPEEDLERIFEPFFTRRDRGSGLGLSIVHRTVQDHGGTISVSSTVGQGTTVAIRFPRVDKPSAADASRPAAPGGPSTRTRPGPRV